MKNNYFSKKDCKLLSDIIIELHVFFDSDAKKVASWLYMDNLNFGGTSPMKLIQRGRIQKVYDFVIVCNDKE